MPQPATPRGRLATSAPFPDTATHFTVMHGRRPPSTVASQSTSGQRLVSKSGEWLLSEGPNVVGRDGDCAIRIDSSTLSRRHARIVVTGREAVVEDLGSKNGTMVNGQRVVEPVVLKDSDQIDVGSHTMTYRIMDSGSSTITRRGI